MAGEGLNKGWISIYRKIQDDWLWQDKPFSKGQAWIDLLLLVNHRDNKTTFDGRLIITKRGEHITSIRKLSDRWGWSNTKVKNFLNDMQIDEKISYKSDSKKTTINIVNYGAYQDINDSKNATETPLTTHRNATETPLTHTNNNDNNDNNDNKRESFTHSQALDLCNYYSQLKPGEFITSQLSTIKVWIEVYGFDWTKEAIQMCVSKKNKFIVSWINKVLQNWQSEGKEDKHGSNKQHIESADREGIGIEV